MRLGFGQLKIKPAAAVEPIPERLAEAMDGAKPFHLKAGSSALYHFDDPEVVLIDESPILVTELMCAAGETYSTMDQDTGKKTQVSYADPPLRSPVLVLVDQLGSIVFDSKTDSYLDASKVYAAIEVVVRKKFGIHLAIGVGHKDVVAAKKILFNSLRSLPVLTSITAENLVESNPHPPIEWFDRARQIFIDKLRLGSSLDEGIQREAETFGQLEGHLDKYANLKEVVGTHGGTEERLVLLGEELVLYVKMKAQSRSERAAIAYRAYRRHAAGEK